jgi:hypothetical protein
MSCPKRIRWRVRFRMNIALMTRALLTLFSGARSGNGMLSKAALARCLPLESRAKARQTRLARFLANPHFTPEAMVPLLVALAVGTTFKERLPMIMDQTTLHGLPTLLVGLVFEGRALPVAFTCFSYEAIEKSQNAIERALMLTVAACFPPAYRPVLVMDRGYARAQLLPRLTSAGIPFLIRAPKNVCVFVGKEWKSLGRFPAPRGSLALYEILYHEEEGFAPCLIGDSAPGVPYIPPAIPLGTSCVSYGEHHADHVMADPVMCRHTVTESMGEAHTYPKLGMGKASRNS